MDEIYININDFDGFLKTYLENTFRKDIISIEELISCLEDEIAEKERIEEDLNNLQRDLEDNYRPIPVSEQYDIDDRYFG